MINSLRKTKKRDGALYTRLPEVEAELNQLDALSRVDLIARCALAQGQPGFVRNECLFHFARRGWATQDKALYEPLLPLLLHRVRQRLPRAISHDNKSVSLSRSDAAEQVYDTFVGMLLGEKEAYDERLDFFEILFARGLAYMSFTAQGRAGRTANRRDDLTDEESGELEPEVEEAVGNYDPFAAEVLDQNSYRSALAGAISRLKPIEKRIVEMCRREIPLDSKDPAVITMVSLTGRSEKGIRNIRDRAYAKLRRALTKGEQA